MSRLKQVLISMTRGGIVDRIAVSEPTLFLTFDDGPHPVYTPEMLALLSAHHAHASFFLVGSKSLEHAAITRDILARGHTLGNHSFSHRPRRNMTASEASADIRRCDEALHGFDGRVRHPYRPPWGKFSAWQYLQCLTGRDRIVLWSRNSMDYRDKGDVIIGHFDRQPPRPGDVILFHDDSSRSLVALRELLPKWTQLGFRFAPLPGIL